MDESPSWLSGSNFAKGGVAAGADAWAAWAGCLVSGVVATSDTWVESSSVSCMVFSWATGAVGGAMGFWDASPHAAFCWVMSAP